MELAASAGPGARVRAALPVRRRPPRQRRLVQVPRRARPRHRQPHLSARPERRSGRALGLRGPRAAASRRPGRRRHGDPGRRHRSRRAVAQGRTPRRAHRRARGPDLATRRLGRRGGRLLRRVPRDLRAAVAAAAAQDLHHPRARQGAGRVSAVARRAGRPRRRRQGLPGAGRLGADHRGLGAARRRHRAADAGRVPDPRAAPRRRLSGGPLRRLWHHRGGQRRPPKLQAAYGFSGGSARRVGRGVARPRHRPPGRLAARGVQLRLWLLLPRAVGAELLDRGGEVRDRRGRPPTRALGDRAVRRRADAARRTCPSSSPTPAAAASATSSSTRTAGASSSRATPSRSRTPGSPAP
jgi:hypothetical protein